MRKVFAYLSLKTLVKEGNLRTPRPRGALISAKSAIRPIEPFAARFAVCERLSTSCLTL